MDQLHKKKIRQLIYDYSGIILERVCKVRFEQIIQNQMKRNFLNNINDYCQILQSSQASNPVMDELLSELTVNESYFFRNTHQFEYLYTNYLPYLIETNKLERNIKIWSAGCAKGEEPYSIAVIVNKLLKTFYKAKFSIYAGDISNKNIDIATKGYFSKRSIRKSDLKMNLNGFYTEENGIIKIAEDIKQQVIFKYINLKKFQSLQSFAGSDIIFCRNVLIYFDEEFRVKLCEEFHKHLNAGGLLLLGESECLPLENILFEPIHFKKSYIYRKIG